MATRPRSRALADRVRPASNPLPPGRPLTGHILAAAALALVICGIYGTIAWGMFIGSPDFRAHMNLARQFYETGRPSVQHFLFHGLTVALFSMGWASSFESAGRWVMVGSYLATSLLLYALFWMVFRRTRMGRPPILFAAALATFLAQPITLRHAYTVGYFWPEPYQIPTSAMLKPFALAGFACAAWYLSRRVTPDKKLTGSFAVATIAGALTKPSFLICILPSAGALMLHRVLRKSPVSVKGLLFGLYIPSVVILGWQYYQTYAGSGANGVYHDAIDWAPFKFMHYLATGLLWKFLLSILFPLVVTVVYWRQAIRDTMLQLAWLCFLFGAFYSYMLAERLNWYAGNFTWSGNISAFILFVGSVVFWLRRLSIPERALGDWCYFAEPSWLCTSPPA